jgi:Flp pilus assembly protein TadG
MLEFAIVLPLLVSFLIAIVTGGLAIGQSVSLNNAARESARYGAVMSVDGDLNAWLGRVADVAVSAASGDLSASTTGQSICVAYVYPDGVDTNDRTVRIQEVGGVRTTTVGASCLTDGRPSSERRVQVAVSRTGYFDAFVFATNLTLDGHSVAQFERFDR